MSGVELTGEKTAATQIQLLYRAADYALAFAIGGGGVDDGAAQLEQPLDYRLERRVVCVAIPNRAKADHRQFLTGSWDRLGDQR
jgi:hypothetical protein